MNHGTAQSATPGVGFRRLYIFGAGGSGREVAWLAEECWAGAVELVFLVDKPEYLSSPVNGVPVQLLQEAEIAPDCRFVVALGDALQRRKAVSACMGRGLLPSSVIHPRAEISRSVTIGNGVVIYPGTATTVNTVMGDHAQVNVGCTISHDVHIGEFSTLSPGVHVAGHVRIGCDVFIGTGANIINGCAEQPLFIGNGAVVAAGACVIHPVEPGAMVAGVPAVRKR